MLKKIQRVNKEAFKFQFTISYQELVLDCYKKWYPKAVHLSWSRRDKILTTKTHPVIADPDVNQRFLLTWPIPENQVAVVTLFRSSSSAYFDPKFWVFNVYEGEQLLGTQKINLSENASTIPKQLDLKITLNPSYCELKGALLHLTISSSLIRHGKATDEDQFSLGSYPSFSKVKGDSEDDLGHSGLRSRMKSQMFSSFRVKKTKSNYLNARNHYVNNVTGRYNLDEYETSFGAESTKRNKRPISPTPPSQLSSISSLNPSSSSLPKPPSSLSTSSSPSNQNIDPSEELLSWARSVTKDHHLGIPLDNLTTAWRNGVAFCAIIHHFKPHHIDFDSLDPTDAAGNCKIAFEAGEKLGVASVMKADDMVQYKVPDKLKIITYLFQLKSFFAPSSQPQTSKPKRHPKPFRFSFGAGKKSSSSSFQASSSGTQFFDAGKSKLNGSDNASIKSSVEFKNNGLKSRSSSRDVVNNENSHIENNQLNLQNLSITEENSTDIKEYELKPNTSALVENKKSSEDDSSDVPQNNMASDIPISLPKTTVSPSTSLAKSSPESFIQPPESHNKTSTRDKIMTRKQLYNPFDSDSEDDHSNNASLVDQTTSTPIKKQDVVDNNLFISENSESKNNEKANSENNIDNSTQSTTKTKQEILKERAKIMISEYAERLKTSPRNILAGIMGGGVEEEAGTQEGEQDKERQTRLRNEARLKIFEFKKSFTAQKNDSIDYNYYFNEYGEVDDEYQAKENASNDIICHSDISNNNTNATHDTQEASVSKDTDKKSSYLLKEVKSLEEKQQNLNEVISRLEIDLRRAIDEGNKKMEIMMLKEWFSLVNYKNAMSRRQDQLNIEMDEEDLEKRFTFLSMELRTIMELAEWEKNNEVRKREEMLMEELVGIVDKRDEMVRKRDQTEQQIGEDEESQRRVKEILISRQETHACVVM